ncbi:MAG: phospho-N-acetylmuramoyl-pentapeptide-transferase [Paludibacteraceae bacterium]|nr:phospho-N-acetylmuramoyl-pentapeptide-transferase [Paludibacteraceae bacterium]MBR4712474.1 phospho-N-acetylmuramoyl-pentapeptide-transferase [Paludibacteraceae bacterium]MBR5373462.1 phospho-N-acetylmuramoyl-pentapeptide-transferase [Paludibacteraceae bacterium]
MFYYLFNYLSQMNVPGAGMFKYISFRSAFAFIFALLIATFIGKRIIRFLQQKQIGETIRDLDLAGQMAKKGTPTMGGIIIIISILLPVLLFGKLDNVYILLMIVTTLWLGAMGFLDDFIKVYKKDKEGLHGKFKILGQVGLGLIVGLTLYMSQDVVIYENTTTISQNTEVVEYAKVPEKSTKTTIPFVKNPNFDYADLFGWAGDYAQTLGWIFFVLVVIFIVTAVSNGANLTDGLDGLSTGVSAIVGSVLGILAYLSSHAEFASYLNIMYIPYSEELVIFICAFVGALIGFLWYNAYPAQVFMGDTGSLMIGGVIAVSSIIIRKELLLPVLCGIFFMESLSVIIQTSYFKYTKKKYGEGRRIFRMAPLHHHYQKMNIPEPKIVARFWIVCLLLAMFTIVTLKIR